LSVQPAVNRDSKVCHHSARVPVAERRFRHALAGILLLVLLPQGAAAETAPAVRKILLLQSLDRGSMVFDKFTADFRTVLQERTREPITLVEFVVAPAGFTEAPGKPMLDFLQSIFADQAPALIVTVGGPAAAFVRSNRQHLFPKTPVLFSAVDQRYLGAAPLAEHETSAAVAIDYTKVLDDILQLLPDTRNVFVVTGTGPLSNFWYAELQRNFERYQNRLKFIWSGDLSYEQMLQRAATLPRHSAIYYVSSGTFATGGWQSEQRTLADFSARANAPVFGAQGAWLGAGIVGGRLLDIEGLGASAADAAVRLLNGESAARIHIPALSMAPPMFDARELTKWKIPEVRLPRQSVVQFQEPSLWGEYRAEVFTGIGVVVFESLLIVGLLYERRARYRAEVESRRNLALAADANRRTMTSALAGSMAHELSQPLNSILHNAEAADMLIASGRATPETLREIVSDIRHADVRATEIIDRHRTMLRNHPMDQRPVDIHGVVREGIAVVASDTRARHVRLDVDLPLYPCLVNGDQVLLQQVVVNLVMNAIDAMADTPADQRRVTVRNEVTTNSVTVSVRDEGSGLPASDDKLFEPFVTTKTSGLGIGLTIARTIVEAHHGRLDARNNPDGGATFVMTLPWYAAAAVN